jgi:hypothetical protein
MQQTPNFNNRQILSKEELKVWDNSLRELIGNVLRYNRVTEQVGGILDAYDINTSQFVNDFFYTEIGSVPSGGFNTLKIGAGRAILNVEDTAADFVNGLNNRSDALKNQLVSLFKWDAMDNIVVTGIAGYNEGDEVFVGFLPIWNPLESGVCAISANNQVTISGGDFLKLRGQSTKNPTKVRFYELDGTPASNNQTYEVVSITNSTSMIISGSVSAETNLKMLIVGSYDLAVQGSLSDKFSYTTATGLLTFTLTSTDITENGGFIVAKLVFGTAGSFTVTDLRIDNLFNFAYSPDVMYKSLAQVVTGQKTFTTKSPIFDMPVVSKPATTSFATPIVINDSTHVLTIPNTGGGVYKVTNNKGYPIGLAQILFEDGFVAGTRLSLLYDEDIAQNLTLWLRYNLGSSTIGKIQSVNQAETSTDLLTILPGNFIELWADENLMWHVTNYLNPLI